MRVRPRSFQFAAAVLAGGLAVTAAGAQTAAPASAAPAAAGIDSSPAARGRAALVGRVHAPGDSSLADAELTVLGADQPQGRSGDGRSARTGPGGAFRIDSITPGRYFVRVRRLGFEPLYFSATLDGGTTRRIDVEMSALPARLAEVKVRDRSGYDGFAEKRLRDFEFRRRAGFGRFFTRDDLKSYQGQQLSDALRYLLVGVSRRSLDAFSPFPMSFANSGCARFGGYGQSLGYGSSNFGRGGLGCGVRVSINGMVPVPGDVVADFPVRDIEAIEVYGSVIVVWTGSETDD